MFDSDKNAEGELTPNIQNIAIDTRRKKIYWTDPTLTEGKGKIACSNYDGSDYKVVIHELHWPQGTFSTFHIPVNCIILQPRAGSCDFYRLENIGLNLVNSSAILLFSIEIHAGHTVHFLIHSL